MTQYRAKNPAVAQTPQNAIVPAIGWILSANEIKLVIPAMMIETRHTVISAARTMINFLPLEFCDATSAFTVLHLLCTQRTPVQSKRTNAGIWIVFTAG
jgi:hypothetical protein